jgi:hypothetical protein
MTQKTYSITASGLTVAGATTLVAVRAPASAVNLELLEARVAQNGTSTQEQIRVAIGRQAAALPTVTSATPEPLRAGGTASVVTGATNCAAGTCGVNASAEGGGVFTPIVSDCFSNLNGWLWLPPGDGRIVHPSGAADILSIKLLEAPTGLTKWAVALVFREV